MNSDMLNILKFFLLPSRFFCFPLDSAALSDSWSALILIIALHEYVFLFFSLIFLLFGCSPLVQRSLFFLNHGYASAGNWLELCMFGYNGIPSWFGCFF